MNLRLPLTCLAALALTGAASAQKPSVPSKVPQPILLVARAVADGTMGIDGLADSFLFQTATFSVQTYGSTGIVGGGGASKPQLNQLVVTRAADDATTKLFLACVQGKQFAKATIHTGNYNLTLSDVAITSISHIIKENGEVIDSFNLRYAKIEFQIGGSKASFDSKTNKIGS